MFINLLRNKKICLSVYVCESLDKQKLFKRCFGNVIIYVDMQFNGIKYFY